MKLSDIESLELVDRRGYLTITISQLREGKIFLRTTQGLQDWYNVIQVNTQSFFTLSYIPKRELFGCFIIVQYLTLLVRWPSDSIVSKDAGLEPRAVATFAYPAKHFHHWDRSHPCFARCYLC